MQLSQFVYCIQMHNENTYIIFDDKIILIDAICSSQWLKQLENLLDNRSPDYFIMSHEYQTETILSLCQKYPHMHLMLSIDILHQYNFDKIKNSISAIKDIFNLKHHTLYFLTTNNIIMTYIVEDKILLSSQFFSTNNQYTSWKDNARYEYTKNWNHSRTSIVNLIKYFEIAMICPSYGQIINDHIKQYIRYLELWEQCIPEEDGVYIITASSNNQLYQVCQHLQNELIKHGDNAFIGDIDRSDMTFLVSQIFKYDRIIICIDNIQINKFLNKLQNINLQNRVVGFICYTKDQYFFLKDQLSCLNNILYIEPMILDKNNLTYIDQYANTIMEVGCVDGACI
ncbi:MAG: hypothetical protein LUG12_10965 [Erysipelotrichaceae bacterium]|nr:hypothetical protein [Erysipelotrichaceae bacterium]